TDRMIARIPDDHHPLVRIVGVDRTGRVRDLKSLLEGRPAARPDLCLDSDRQSCLEAEWDERGGAAFELERAASRVLGRGSVPRPLSVRTLDGTTGEIGTEIIARGARSRPRWSLGVAMEQFDDDRVVRNER